MREFLASPDVRDSSSEPGCCVSTDFSIEKGLSALKRIDGIHFLAVSQCHDIQRQYKPDGHGQRLFMASRRHLYEKEIPWMVQLTEEKAGKRGRNLHKRSSRHNEISVRTSSTATLSWEVSFPLTIKIKIANLMCTNGQAC